ncbi:hypothetical protein CH330_03825 [candidate division WOR-3 bacterium JGI_Cruoil_03_51_56]|uniref:HEPN domain-containing protein n=1 Tax=candidate division WOR-3 bacterium JGI_Cruoil_03_51_56 TaxID=1973747 RepID=A0A235BUY4_UNCW3|nr:MAG: hypothetical protein CH330_03825 [candidate division WOR-3 bacterium JGI_Cruoil_03_51_56]
MSRTHLKPKTLRKLIGKMKGRMAESSIRSELSRIRGEHPALTLNAAAQVFANRRGFSVLGSLSEEDRLSLAQVPTERVVIKTVRVSRKEKFKRFAAYTTSDSFLKKHIDEINEAYNAGCFTATFVLCRKALENLLVHHILRRKYPGSSATHKLKYFDIQNRRALGFSTVIKNVRRSSSEFGSERQLVERICELSDGFKDDADKMTHSLYHIASRPELDGKQFQDILEMIGRLEATLRP